MSDQKKVYCQYCLKQFIEEDQLIGICAQFFHNQLVYKTAKPILSFHKKCFAEHIAGEDWEWLP